MTPAPQTFVLVHGAWGGGYQWRAVADILTARGHRVYRPSLTGLADRNHLALAGVNLTTHIADIVNLLVWEDLSSVVMVGHSYAGTVISGVAEKIAPGVVASLVLIDAAYPTDGESHFDHTGRTDYPHDLLMPYPGVRNGPDGKPLPPQPLATLTEPLHLTGARERIPKKMFIAGSQSIVRDRPAIKAIAQDPGWRYVELPCGHDVPQALPEETANLLEEAAR